MPGCKSSSADASEALIAGIINKKVTDKINAVNETPRFM
jgi:hypothetical protein